MQATDTSITHQPNFIYLTFMTLKFIFTGISPAPSVSLQTLATGSTEPCPDLSTDKIFKSPWQDSYLHQIIGDVYTPIEFQFLSEAIPADLNSPE